MYLVQKKKFLDSKLWKKKFFGISIWVVISYMVFLKILKSFNKIKNFKNLFFHCIIGKMIDKNFLYNPILFFKFQEESLNCRFYSSYYFQFLKKSLYKFKIVSIINVDLRFSKIFDFFFFIFDLKYFDIIYLQLKKDFFFSKKIYVKKRKKIFKKKKHKMNLCIKKKKKIEKKIGIFLTKI
jgi:hypothetical protein